MKITSNPTGNESNTSTNSMTHSTNTHHPNTKKIQAPPDTPISHTRDITNNYQPVPSEGDFPLQKVLKPPPITRPKKQTNPKDNSINPSGNISIIKGSKPKNKF